MKGLVTPIKELDRNLRATAVPLMSFKQESDVIRFVCWLQNNLPRLASFPRESLSPGEKNAKRKIRRQRIRIVPAP